MEPAFDTPTTCRRPGGKEIVLPMAFIACPLETRTRSVKISPTFTVALEGWRLSDAAKAACGRKRSDSASTGSVRFRISAPAVSRSE
jgi:hypothetical protein